MWLPNSATPRAGLMGFICWNVVLEVGGPEEADLQRAQLPGPKGWIRKEIEKAIRKIERRK